LPLKKLLAWRGLCIRLDKSTWKNLQDGAWASLSGQSQRLLPDADSRELPEAAVLWEARVIKVLLKGPDGKQETVIVNEDATVRDVATEGYNLFFCNIRLNGDSVPPTVRVHDGDRVEVVGK